MTKILEGNIIKKAHEEVEYTESQLNELTLCMPEANEDAHHYFMTHFGYLKHPTRGKLLYVPYDYQIKLVDNFHNYRFNINMLGRQMGKALAGSTPILTVSGFKYMKDIRVGDYVFGQSGEPTLVVFKTEAQRNRDCYKITFDNGETIIADAQHDWFVEDKATNVTTTKTTVDLLNISYKYRIPLTAIVDYSDTRFGDIVGFKKFKNSIEKRKYIIEEVAIKNSKVIDGFYTLTAPKRDIEELQFILASVGIKSKVKEGNVIEFSVLAYAQMGRASGYIFIDKIEKVKTAPVYCIEVDNDEHIFLAGRTLIPTHNCVVGDTKIKIKNKHTNEAMEITIKEFHDLIKKGLLL